MADTLRDLIGHLRLHVPQLPYFLAERFVQQAYEGALSSRHWASLRRESLLLPGAAYTTGTVTATRNSTTLVGSGTSWTSQMVGRQLMVGARAPVYTVAAVVSPTQITLDMVFSGSTASSLSYRILDAYVALPTDTRELVAVVDLQQQWKLRHYITQEELNAWDPGRTTTGTPTCLVDLKVTTAGAPVYELWPYCTSEQAFLVWYYATGSALGLDDSPVRPITGEVVLKGALRDVARWPGTAAEPNPLFGKGLDAVYAAEYNEQLTDLAIEDETLMLTWLSSGAQMPWAPMSASWRQSHAV